MTINHHPSDAMLLSYASGSLTESWALGVASHLAYCGECRTTVAQYENIGGALLDETEPAELSVGALDNVLARLSDEPELNIPANDHRPILPSPLWNYVKTESQTGQGMDGLPWQRLGVGAYHLPLLSSGKFTTARLLRIPANMPVPEHGHNGSELTLVLSGGFTDATGHFLPGDIEETDETIVHTPHADPGEDCIVLAITDAPLRFSNWWARLAQPMIGI